MFELEDHDSQCLCYNEIQQIPCEIGWCGNQYEFSEVNSRDTHIFQIHTCQQKSQRERVRETGSSCRFTVPIGGFGLWEKPCGAARLSPGLSQLQIPLLFLSVSCSLSPFTHLTSFDPCVPLFLLPSFSSLLHLSCVQLLTFCHTSLSNWNVKSTFLHLFWPLSLSYHSPSCLLLHMSSLSLQLSFTLLCSFVLLLSYTSSCLLCSPINSVCPSPPFSISCFPQVSYCFFLIFFSH